MAGGGVTGFSRESQPVNQYAPGQSRAQNKGGVLLHSDIRAVETLQDQVQTSHGAQSLSVVHLQHGQEASERIIMMDHPGAARRSWSGHYVICTIVFTMLGSCYARLMLNQ